VLYMKDQSDFRVNRTRPISLKKADQNENAKQTEKDTMVAVEKYNCMANKQYVSCLYRSAIHLATSKRLIYDVSHQMEKPIVVCSNGARSCYGKIVHIAAFLALRRMVIAKPIIISMLHTIQMMEHIIRTSYDDSTETYGSSEWRLPPHGKIYGNGASPLIWVGYQHCTIYITKRKELWWCC